MTLFSNRALRKLILPLVVEQTFVMMVGMADTIMVSYAGEAAISGVALVDMIDYLIITVLSAVAAGGAVVISQYLGCGDRQNANFSASQLHMIAGLVSAVIMLVGLMFHRGILNVLFGSVDADVMESATAYFLIIALSFPFLGLYNSAAALFRSMQKTRQTMYASLMMNVFNIVGNGIGIFIFHAGAAGVAASTLVSRAVTAILMVLLAFGRENPVWICWKEILVWNREIAGKILRIAIPSGIENGLFSLGKVLVISIVALFGTVQITAGSVANNVDQIAIIVVNAVNLAMITVVGQCVGAKEYEQAACGIRKLMMVSYLAAGALSVGVFFLLPVILNHYQVSPETYSLSFFLIVMHNGLAILLHPTSFNLANSLRAAGDVQFTMWVGTGSMIVFRLGTAVLLGVVLHMGVIGVWIAMGMDWLVRSAAFVMRYRSGKWRQASAI